MVSLAKSARPFGTPDGGRQFAHELACRYGTVGIRVRQNDAVALQMIWRSEHRLRVRQSWMEQRYAEGNPVSPTELYEYNNQPDQARLRMSELTF